MSQGLPELPQGLPEPSQACGAPWRRSGGGWSAKVGEFFRTAPNGIIGLRGSQNSKPAAAAEPVDPEVVAGTAAQSLPFTRAGDQDDGS